MALHVILCVPRVVRKIADCYKDIATKEGIPYSALCAYIAMNLYGDSSFSSLCRYAPWTYCCSSLSEYLYKLTRLVQDRILRRLRGRILKQIKNNPDGWILVVDTTKKPSHIAALNHCGSWRESSHNAFFGLNLLDGLRAPLVAAGVVDVGVAPLAVEVEFGHHAAHGGVQNESTVGGDHSSRNRWSPHVRVRVPKQDYERLGIFLAPRARSEALCSECGIGECGETRFGEFRCEVGRDLFD